MTQRISRGTNHLGNIRRILRDLTGYSTLAHELIQNADDAGDASRLVFDVRDDALVLFNDGAFSDCGQQDLGLDECPWLEEHQPPRRCDFHSFREVGSGDKGNRSDTTGAFGIGFTAVYQITDAPELISSDRHWMLDELAAESDRIAVCDGCTACQGAAGTTFILPWAVDDSSPMRERLKAPPVGSDDPTALTDILTSAVPTSMLFLRRLEEIEIQRNGERVGMHLRSTHDDIVDLLVEPDADVMSARWKLIFGEFDEAAAELRSSHPGKLDDLRSARVVLAVPDRLPDRAGLLCAYLPTEETSGLPIHVNADFLPVSDRRRVHHDGLAGEWNRKALEAAARLLRDHIEDLRSWLAPEDLWRLLRDAETTHRRATLGDLPDVLTTFWSGLLESLSESEVMLTTDGEWRTVAGTLVLVDEDEYSSAATLLTELGLPLAHISLRPYLFSLPSTLGHERLALRHVCAALESLGLEEGLPVAQLPHPLSRTDAHHALLEEVERLLDRRTGSSKEAVHDLVDLPIMPGTDGNCWSLSTIRVGSPADRKLLDTRLDLIPFVDVDSLPSGPDSILLHHVKSVDPRDVIDWCDGNPDWLGEQLEQEPGLAIDLIKWFSRNDDAVHDLREEIAELPIFPSPAGLRPLTALALPGGGFEDPLGLADIVELEKLEGHVGFLESLGGRSLSLVDYITEVVPRHVQLASTEPERWRRLIELTALRLGELIDDEATRASLIELPLVLTNHGFVRGRDAYFHRDDLTSLVGGDVPVAVLPAIHHAAVRTLYRQLGVVSHPRPHDVVAHVERIVDAAPTQEARSHVQSIISYVGSQIKPDGSRTTLGEYDALRDIAWMPVEEDTDRWHAPQDVALSFQRHLFASEGRFLDLDLRAQQEGSDFLQALGCQRAPEPQQVVAHLLTCSGQDETVYRDVYRFLNDHADDPGLDRLKGRPCLLIEDVGFVRPDVVYWHDHPFGERRYRIGPDLATYGALLQRLDVKEHPDAYDARALLLEIQAGYAEFNTSVRDSDDAIVVQRCWQLIEMELADLDTEWFLPLSRGRTIPDARGIFTQPQLLLFDDAPHISSAVGTDRLPGVIPRPPDSWRAMERAGVRRLSKAIREELVEVGTTRPADDVRQTLMERRALLVRVLDAEGVDDVGARVDQITVITFSYATPIRIVYSLDRPRLVSDEQSPAAVLIETDYGPGILLAQGGGTTVAFARELVRALGLEEKLGRLALPVARVLMAPSGEAAASELDEAGIPRLSEVDLKDLAPSVAGGLGAESTGHGHQTSEGAYEPETTPSTEVDEDDRIEPEAAKQGLAVTDTSPIPAVGSSGTPSGQGNDRQPSDASSSRSTADSRDRKSKSSGRRTRLISYVSPKDSDNTEPDRSRDTGDTNAEVDAAGVAHVLAFEEASGRIAAAMPHNNPGYDVESNNLNGNIERYIEVKSIGDRWDTLGVTLTSTQMKHARELGDAYWLYVVEHADSEHGHRIHAIQNPAAQIDSYGFDYKWQEVETEGFDAASTRPTVEPPRLLAEDPGGAVPCFLLGEATDLDAGPAGYLRVDPETAKSDFVVQVPGRSLMPELNPGDLAGVARVDEQDLEEGDWILASLNEADPDTGSRWTLRTWWPERLEGGKVIRLVLGTSPGSTVEPLETRGDVEIYGRVLGRVRTEVDFDAE